MSYANTVKLTVFRMADLSEWQDRLVRAIEKAGFGASRKGSSCRLWRNDQFIAIRDRPLRYVDGVRVLRCRIGRGLGALAIRPQRYYFEGESNQPSSSSERTLVGDRAPALASAPDRISGCLEWAQRIADVVQGFDPRPVEVESVRMELEKKTQLRLGGNAVVPAGAKVSNAITGHGFLSVPDNFRIVIAATEDSTPKAATYQQHLMLALKRCCAPGKVDLFTYDQVASRIEKGAVPPPGTSVLLAVTGRKGEPLRPEAQQLLAGLERAGIPFRLFSADNPALTWSALDQIGSLLSAAGGIPYALELPWPEHVGEPFLVGVDLGHPLKERISRVVLTLLDHRGVLLANWQAVQKRDETIDANLLFKGLRWAHGQARDRSHGAKTGFLVLRDGLLNKGEPAHIYMRALGRRTTLVEFSKYDNPIMFIDDGSCRPVCAGTECVLKGSHFPFLTPVSPRLKNDLARTFKVQYRREWDGLKLGRDTICDIVTGLSYAPGLGLAQHALPAPIYWADGIAAIGETNHQFAGIIQG